MSTKPGQAQTPILVVALTVGGRRDAIELRIEPSRLLYGLDRTAFLGVLTEIPGTVGGTADDEVTDLQSIPIVEPPEPHPPRRHPKPGANKATGVPLGVFKDLRPGLRKFLVSEGIIARPHDQLLDSLLMSAESNSGIDWQIRDGLQSRMKVGFRRVLAKEGADPTKIHDASERIFAWLKLSVPTATSQMPANSPPRTLGGAPRECVKKKGNHHA